MLSHPTLEPSLRPKPHSPQRRWTARLVAVAVAVAALTALGGCGEDAGSGTEATEDTGAGDTGTTTQADATQGDTRDDATDSAGGDTGPTPCTVGNECVNSGVCANGFCADPTCADGVRNSDESGVDCGGPTCDRCGGNQQCRSDADCLSEDCLQGLCTAPPLRPGEPCDANTQCASDRCEAIGADPQKFCTRDCDAQTPCDGVNVACFRGQCVPNTYCDDPDSDGVGNGPGCDGTICQTCDPNSTCAEQSADDFICTCNGGFSGSGTTCADVNECNDPSLHDCHPTWGGCVNTVGAFLCECLSGFDGDGRDCADVNECDAAPNPCGIHQCNNIPGGFNCACAPGYAGTHPDCADIDECADPAQNPCGLGTCQNTPGAYTCACPSGYSFRSGTCQDINECTENPNICGLTAQCANTDGGFACACNDGYRYQNTQCVDINECAETPNLCGPGACQNTLGTYRCDCDPGYAFTNGTCEDIDSCADPALNDCAPDATCADTVGGFTCTCDPGFTGDGTTCDDIDECADPALNTCAADATCTNSPGTYACACDPGFTGDGTTCADIDECADPFLNACDPDGATCTNTAGGFTCACDPGFSGDGFVCTDIDECADPAANPCGAGTCANTTGDYTCACPTGYDDTPAPSPRCLPTSCLALLTQAPATPDGTHELLLQAGPTFAYCDMTTDGGGWTLALKDDGRTAALGYDDPLWTNTDTLNPTSTNLTDRVDAKLDAFNDVAFTEVLVGMEQPIQAAGPLSLRYLKLAKPAASPGSALRVLFAGPNDQITATTRAEWLALIPGADLQPECNKGGFNVIPSDPARVADHARARVGFIANQETDCTTTDSRIGVGTSGESCTTEDGTSAGNVAGCLPAAAPNLNTPSFGVLFIR